MPMYSVTVGYGSVEFDVLASSEEEARRIAYDLATSFEGQVPDASVEGSYRIMDYEE